METVRGLPEIPTPASRQGSYLQAPHIKDRRESGAWCVGRRATGSGAEGQDLPSQLNLWILPLLGKGVLNKERYLSIRQGKPLKEDREGYASVRHRTGPGN
jgi:hypothetical protein